MTPSLPSSLAETGLIGAIWLNVASWASAAQELPVTASTATVTLSIAIGGIMLQMIKMYFDFRGRQQAIELEQVKHDLAEEKKVIQSKTDDIRRRDEELVLRTQEVEELRKLLYARIQNNDAPRSPHPADGQPKPVD
jgi:hypothetical protein